MKESTQELAIEIRGEIVANNFDQFSAQVSTEIAAINYELVTEEDFANAEVSIKKLKHIEEVLKLAEQSALDGNEDIAKLTAKLQAAADEVREARLGLEKQVKAEKVAIKAGIIATALERINHRIDIGFKTRVTDATKSRRTIESLTEAANAEADKINGELEEAREIMERFREDHGSAILHGEDDLVRMDAGALEIEMERRVERAAAAEEALKVKQKLQAVADEAAKMEKQLRAAEALTEKSRVEALPPAPAPAPAPAPITDRPTGSPAIKAPAPVASNELADFIAVLAGSFAPVKVAREALTDPYALEAAGVFALALRGAWMELQKAAELQEASQ